MKEEFNFKVNDSRDKTVYKATMINRKDTYRVSWNNDIYSNLYPLDVVEKYVKEGNWVVV